jgi:DNA-binding transcriptional regulator YhcF (GntR family)
MEGRIDSSFTTEQRDLFASGIVAEIGTNAYAVWHGIKFYADFNTGKAFPGMRKLGEKLGISAPTVMRAIDVLIKAKMLRVVQSHTKRRGQTYIARERMSVTVGSMTLCTIVIDYVPERLRSQVKRISESLKTGEHDPEAFAEVEIIPGDGFEWDEKTKTLRGKIAAAAIPAPSQSAEDYHTQLGREILARIKAPKK